MNNSAENPACNCHKDTQACSTEKTASKVRTTTKALPSIFTSILIAFFPKCPVCWAVYMSMFGSLGLARLPYMPWLLPVLLLFLAFHLFMLFRKVPQNGFLPFAMSLEGAVMVLSGRFFFPLQQWMLISGMALIISGSLLNSFSNMQITLPYLKRT